MKRCLLDLDGVLVDFVGGACRWYGMVNPYDDPANHGKPRLEELLDIPREEFYAGLGEDFWEDLLPTPECFRLVELVEGHFGEDNVCILTSPLRTHGCYEGKLSWLRRHIPQFKRRFLVGPRKEFAASQNAWLVDDSDENITRFQCWGGNTAQVPHPSNSLHRFAGSSEEIIRQVANSLGLVGTI